MGNLQNQFLAQYCEKYTEPFNPQIMIKKDEDIIEAVKKVILSAQRDKFFTIKVQGFRTIDSYIEIENVLHSVMEKRKNKRIKINVIDYIDMKPSDIKLLEVSYYLEVNGDSRSIKVYIAIPRIVDKYYFRIAGSLYSAMYQIVDGSIYNNSSASSKKNDPAVNLKTLNGKVTIVNKPYKNKLKLFGENSSMSCKCFIADMFGKKIPLIKFFLTAFGLVETMRYLCISDTYVSDKPFIDPDYYCFEKDAKLYISVPKMYFDRSDVYQSFVYTVYSQFQSDKDTVNEMYNSVYWKQKLSNEYKNHKGKNFNNELQGMYVIESFNHVYDMITHEEIRLPEEYKKDIYALTRWIMYEFNTLKERDNCDLTYKRVRFAEYIASIYAIKLSTNINSVSNLGSKITIEKLCQSLNIRYTHIIDTLAKSNLVAYKNSVNDNDVFMVTKYTYKGISGIGEKRTSAVPTKYRMVNASHLGKVEMNASPNSDPGMSGLLCPYAQLYEGGFFTDYQEPNNWPNVVSEMINEFRTNTNRRCLFEAKQSILGTNEKENIERVDDNICATHNMINQCIVPDEAPIAGYPIEGSGLLSFTWVDHTYDEDDDF